MVPTSGLRAILPWTTLGLCLAALVGSAVLATTLDSGSARIPMAGLLVLGSVLIVYPLVGALILSRRPGNVVGGVLLAFGVVFAVGGFLDAYANAFPPLPGRALAGWVSHTTVQSPASFSLLALLLLLFPDGGLPSRRWRPVAIALVGATLLFVVLLALRPGPLAEVHPETANPLGVDAVGPLWQSLEIPLFVVMIGCLLASAVAVVVRTRRSRGIERLQMRWLAFASAVLAVAILSGPLYFWRSNTASELAWVSTLGMGLLAVPAAVGVAILRFRLYEIDRIISRTLAYALIVAVLVSLYAAAVIGFGAVLRTLAPETSSDLVVAGSTLLVAAAFGPVRRRVRETVDRRFDRTRYDAARTVERFAHQLRDEIDLDALTDDLAETATTVLHPAHTSVWLTESAAGAERP